MCKNLYKSIAVALIALLANFVLANTVFVHTHLSASGIPVTHSHPYLPGGHSHSSVSFDSIGGFNCAASAFEGSATLLSTAPAAVYCRMAVGDIRATEVGFINCTTLRGPPCA